jgi:hypothetical protein
MHGQHVGHDLLRPYVTAGGKDQATRKFHLKLISTILQSSLLNRPLLSNYSQILPRRDTQATSGNNYWLAWKPMIPLISLIIPAALLP